MKRSTIDITVGPELRREGLAREVIRRVQEARKNDGLEVTDRIRLRWFSPDPDVVAALTEHAGLIAHVPTIVLPEETRRELNHGNDTTLVSGLRALRRANLTERNMAMSEEGESLGAVAAIDTSSTYDRLPTLPSSTDLAFWPTLDACGRC